MAKASLKINVWTRGRKRLPKDLSEALAPHLEYLAGMCEQGYVAGQIVDDRFEGWWSIEHEEAT